MFDDKTIKDFLQLVARMREQTLKVNPRRNKGNTRASNEEKELYLLEDLVDREIWNLKNKMIKTQPVID